MPIPLGEPLADQLDQLSELRDLGYSGVWSSEASTRGSVLQAQLVSRSNRSPSVSPASDPSIPGARRRTPKPANRPAMTANPRWLAYTMTSTVLTISSG